MKRDKIKELCLLIGCSGMSPKNCPGDIDCKIIQKILRRWRMIDWNRAEKEYPKSYEKFLDYLRNGWRLHYKGLPLLNYVCFCDFEKFFDDDNDIIIRYKYYERTGMHSYIIYVKKYAKIIENDECYTNYEYCKTQAIYKAFEILEKQLENKR